MPINVPPPQIPASGRGRSCGACLAAHCDGANLSDEVGAHHCRISSGQCSRHSRTIIRTVVRATRGPLVMVVNSSVPAETVPEFIAYAKANPGRLNMASAGNGGTTHVVGELFKVMTGVDMRHVPYRGSPPALAALLGGNAQGMFDLIPPLIEPIKTGKLRALAVTTAQRSGTLPSVPPLTDFVPGYEAAFWGGIGVPTDTPAAIIDKLNREISTALLDPTIKARIADVGYVAFASSPADFGKFIVEETERWGDVILAAGIKPE